MKSITNISAVLIFMIFGVWGAHAQNSRANVILIMADDLGWGDPGFNRGEVIKTPSLDEMASEGVVFSRFYSAAPVCSPTRGSCLSGRHPFRYGIYTANKGSLKKEEITLAEIFKMNGYVTGHFGKWHLGTLDPEFSIHGEKREPKKNYMPPSHAGFDEWFSTELAVPTYEPYSREYTNPRAWKIDGDWRAVYWHNGEPVKKELKGCDSEIIMDRAIPFIEKAVDSNNNFFAVIWFHAPHAPVVGHPKYMKEFYADYPENKQHYYSSVTALDAQVGRLRKYLKNLGVNENTVICFTSDNGPEGNPNANSRYQGSAGEFRGRKRSLYEGGIRVPSIIEWPGLNVAGKNIEIPVVTSDYFPTFCSLLGIHSNAFSRPVDGVNLLPILKGEVSKRNSDIGFQTAQQQTWVTNRYKLVHNLTEKRHTSDNGKTPFHKYELYDLINDPSETENIAEKHPEKVKEMKSYLENWVQSCTRSDNEMDYSADTNN